MIETYIKRTLVERDINVVGTSTTDEYDVYIIEDGTAVEYTAYTVTETIIQEDVGFTCFINGVEYKLEGSINIQEQVGNNTSSTIRVLVEDQETPKSLDIVEIFNGNRRIFFGQCGIPKSPQYVSIYQPKIYDLICNNGNAILQNRIVNSAYANRTITAIVESLYNNYIESEGFVLGTISDIEIVIDVYTAPDINLREVLNELAEICGASWGIDNNKTFYFIVEDEFPVFEVEISDDFMPIEQGMQYVTKDIDQRTVQTIKGATQQTDLQTEYFTYVEDENDILVDYPIIQKPTIYVNTIEVDSQYIGVKGIDDSNPDIIFFFSFNSQIVTYNDSTDFLVADDDITIEYYGQFPIRIVETNDTKIDEISELTGTSGRIENVIYDSTIQTSEDATTVALALLSNYDEARGEITLTLNDEVLNKYGYTINDFNLLAAINFNIEVFDIVGKFVIVERNVYIKNDFLKNVTLKLVDRNFLRSYGQVLKDYQKVQTLTFRDEEIIINRIEQTDNLNLNSGIELRKDIGYFPTSSSVPVDGQIFFPYIQNDVFPSF